MPEDIHDHIDLIQPTTMFARMKRQRTTFRWSDSQALSETFPGASDNDKITLPNGVTVDASCNRTVTISCLKQLYNAVGFTPSGTNGNKIGITGYLGEFANNADLQMFFANQTPAAVGTTFDFVSVNGEAVRKSMPRIVTFSTLFRWPKSPKSL